MGLTIVFLGSEHRRKEVKDKGLNTFLVYRGWTMGMGDVPQTPVLLIYRLLSIFSQTLCPPPRQSINDLLGPRLCFTRVPTGTTGSPHIRRVWADRGRFSGSIPQSRQSARAFSPVVLIRTPPPRCCSMTNPHRVPGLESNMGPTLWQASSKAS